MTERPRKSALSLILDDAEVLQCSALIARQLEVLRSEEADPLLVLVDPLPLAEDDDSEAVADDADFIFSSLSAT